LRVAAAAKAGRRLLFINAWETAICPAAAVARWVSIIASGSFPVGQNGIAWPLN
jgi:hypothetical protein